MLTDRDLWEIERIHGSIAAAEQEGKQAALAYLMHSKCKKKGMLAEYLAFRRDGYGPFTDGPPDGVPHALWNAFWRGFESMLEG